MTGVVLMYHRVAMVADDCYGLAVRPERRRRGVPRTPPGAPWHGRRKEPS